MILGFTGTSKGMSPAQWQAFLNYVTANALILKEFHHGDCVGSDAEAHAIVREHAPRCVVVVHPPIKSGMRALTSGDRERDPKDYLARNRDIVAEADQLVATPDGPERRRSGTWATVRYARAAGVGVLVLA